MIFTESWLLARLQIMAFSTRSRWCGTVPAGADLVRIMAYWCGAVGIWRGAVRIDAVVRISRSVVQKCKWCGSNIAKIFVRKFTYPHFPLAFLRICNFWMHKSSYHQIFVVANLCPRNLAHKPSSTNLRPQSIVCKTANTCTYLSL